MLIIQEIQKIIYNKLINSENKNISTLNIFTCPKINATFPYLIIEINKVNIENNFNKNNYSVNLQIKIFDKNESNIKILSMANSVQYELINIVNISIGNFNIIDICFLDAEINIFNEINSIWKTILNFKILVEEKNE